MSTEKNVGIKPLRKAELQRQLYKFSTALVRRITIEKIAEVSGVSKKEAADRKIIFPKEVEKILEYFT